MKRLAVQDVKPVPYRKFDVNREFAEQIITHYELRITH